MASRDAGSTPAGVLVSGVARKVARGIGCCDGSAAIARDIRVLRLPLLPENFSGRLLENHLFQLPATLGIALVAASFLVEARAKGPRKKFAESAPPQWR